MDRKWMCRIWMHSLQRFVSLWLEIWVRCKWIWRKMKISLWNYFISLITFHAHCPWCASVSWNANKYVHFQFFFFRKEKLIALANEPLRVISIHSTCIRPMFSVHCGALECTLRVNYYRVLIRIGCITYPLIFRPHRGQIPKRKRYVHWTYATVLFAAHLKSIKMLISAAWTRQFLPILSSSNCQLCISPSAAVSSVRMTPICIAY